MARYLIVANQTLGGEELEHKLRDRIDHGEGTFYVVVPMTPPEHEVSVWAPADPTFGMPVALPEDGTDAVEEARKRSQYRLQAILAKIAELGGVAEGQVGDRDPVKAVETVLAQGPFDEVIVSTLPSGLSRWIKMDLPSRIERAVECPVTTVEAEPHAP